MSESKDVSLEADLANHFAAFDTVEYLHDEQVSPDERLLAAAVFILSSIEIGKADPERPKLKDVVTERMELFGATEEEAREFAEKHTTVRGFDRLCQGLHATRPDSPAYTHFKQGYRFKPQALYRDFLDNRRSQG